MAEYILQMKDIDKTFPGATVLNHAGLDVRQGEIMGLIGENGAGKSTLLKILTGLYTRTSGTILFKGREVTYASIEESADDGIAFMHQELNIFPNMTVTENIFLDRKDYVGKFGMIQKKRMEEDARKVLETLGVEIDVNRMGSELSIHEQQMVEIAKAMSMNAELIIMDEPTAALPENEVEIFFQFIRKLNRRGITIIYVSHKMVEIEAICDRVTILRNGTVVDVVNVGETTVEQMVNKMVGRQLDEYYVHTPTKNDGVLLRVSDFNGENFEQVSFELMKSEVLGIYGLAGSGTLELAETLFGYRKPTRGGVTLNGQAIKKTDIPNMVKNGIAYVPLNRKKDGFVRDMSVFENISMVGCGSYRKGIFVDWAKNRDICDKYMEALSIKAVSRDTHVNLLSGGNQQKVVLSKWLSIHPKVLILNEPTRGVDVGAKAEIYNLIDRLVKTEELGILLISSEAPEVLGMTDRVMIMHKGRICATLKTEGLQQERLLKLASGGKEEQSEERQEIT
ncbi:sugar ABC transporter ATP-binding protein [Lacrimispora sp. NSJ-141]|uniref:Sugar ABC transporter ATP-binding protein n=1 Tax=Lientehia hominis TaxID=2897778 RepID=A0AAP2RFX3_9FIRM|nr:sugar ABC transporter ATP-binding protein [Lientehia hominis]MCD2491474.1 sugar ABC transporter ATP-binding protein [Lientehia hominis]